MRQLIARIPLMWFILLLTTLPHLVFALSHWYAFPLHHGLAVGPEDPDPWLRLTLVREWLTGGSWYDHSVANSNIPFYPSTSPWTRPLDIVIATLVHLQPDSVEINLRLFRAALLLPPIWMLLLVLGVYRIIRFYPTPPTSFLMASFLIAATPIIWNYFGLANADHHALLAVLFIWAMGGILRERPTPEQTVVSGILFGLMLWVSVEALMLIAGVYLWYGMAWLRGDKKAAQPLFPLAASIAVTAILALMIERPSNEWLTPVYDSISIAHVFTLVLAALVAAVLHYAPKLPPREKIAVAGIYSAAALVTIYVFYPLLFAGPMAEVDAFIFSDFLPRISEAQPFYRVSLATLVACSLLPLCAILVCIAPWVARKYAFYTPAYSAKLAFFLLITLALYYGQQRWSYYLLPLAITVMAPLLGALFMPKHPAVRKKFPANLLAKMPEEQQVKYRLPILLALAGLPFLLMYFAAQEPKISNIANVTAGSIDDKKLQMRKRTACYKAARIMLRSGALDEIAGKRSVNLYAPTDLGAEILFFTDHRIVASNYHREGPGIRYVWEAENIASEKRLRRYLAHRSIDAVLVCPWVGATPRSILQGISRGDKPPYWLHTLPYNPPPLPKGKNAVESPPILLKVIRN